uniref:Uncharacterized protein n=1 Tax=viral metagenome TaxID=1070528 RepID=A0A6C0HTD4_9ZZZZ
MSLYIHPENQELLWNIINKNSQIQQYFYSYPPNAKDNWFKQIISSFYEKNQNTVFSQEQLLDINKNTILYMINDVKRNIQYKEEQKKQELLNQQSYQKQSYPENFNTNYLKPYSVTENKEDKFIEQFQQYQNNYNSMFDKKAPESVDFREKINDPQISNMDELIQKHLRERDEELKRYAPPAIFSPSTKNEPNIEQPPPPQRPSNRIVIHDRPSNIKLSTEEFREPEINQQKINNDYTVKWLDNENSNDIKNLQKEINELRSLVIQLSNKIIQKEEIREPKTNDFMYKISENEKINSDSSSQYVGKIIGNILFDSDKFIPLKIKTNNGELKYDPKIMYDNDIEYDNYVNEKLLYSMKNNNNNNSIKDLKGYL